MVIENESKFKLNSNLTRISGVLMEKLQKLINKK